MGNAGGTPGDRAAVCRALGLKDEVEAYRLIVSGGHGHVEKLLARGLGAGALVQLGYDAVGMRKLGYGVADLERLGYLKKREGGGPGTEQSGAVAGTGEGGGGGAGGGVAAGAGVSAGVGASREEIRAGHSTPDEIRRMVEGGATAGQLRGKGFTIQHLRTAGCMITDLERCGFGLDDFVSAFSAGELRRAGYGVRELRRHFRGDELRSAGFDASDMRMAGYGVREILNLGYNENQVRTAGFSTNDLSREGLTKQTVDKTRASFM